MYDTYIHVCIHIHVHLSESFFIRSGAAHATKLIHAFKELAGKEASALHAYSCLRRGHRLKNICFVRLSGAWRPRAWSSLLGWLLDLFMGV